MYEYINCYLELRMCSVIAGCGYILPFHKPGTRIAILKVLIWCQIWLWLCQNVIWRREDECGRLE